MLAILTAYLFELLAYCSLSSKQSQEIWTLGYAPLPASIDATWIGCYAY